MCDVFLCFCNFPCGVLGQVWYLIVLIADLCLLTYFHRLELSNYYLLIFILEISTDPDEMLIFSDIASGSAVFAKVTI